MEKADVANYDTPSNNART